MGSSGSRSSAGAQQLSYNAGMQAYKDGQADPSTSKVRTNDPNYDYFVYGYNSAKSAQQQQSAQAGASRQMAQMIAALIASQRASESQFSNALSKQTADTKAAQELAIKNAALARRDELFSERLTNASLATDYVTSQLKEEASTANLLGVDFNVTDEQKAGRINDYFATLWGEGSQKELDTLIKNYGGPDGFDGNWGVTRGNASNTTSTTQASADKTISTSRGVPKLATLATDEEFNSFILG